MESFLILASPMTSKSAVFSVAPAPPSAQVRKPKDLMRSLRMFSATGDGCGEASDRSASRTEICTATFGSPLARISSTRSSRDMSLSDFCTAFTLTTASVVIDIKPSLPMRGSLSRTTVLMKLPLLDSSRSLSRS